MKLLVQDNLQCEQGDASLTRDATMADVTTYLAKLGYAIVPVEPTNEMLQMFFQWPITESTSPAQIYSAKTKYNGLILLSQDAE